MGIDKEVINKLDSEKMLETTYNWPELIKEIIDSSLINIPEKVVIGNYNLDYKEPIKNIAIIGMGKS